jgi:short subunit dehydrogenase-like uncharacterized protein
MAVRIVVFGATGYTGRLVLDELLARGCRPVVAGRNEQKAAALAAEHGGLPTAVADVTRPDSVRALIEAGDVLVTTVGPFSLYGQAALDAAIDAGAHYIDAAGESDFLRCVFTHAGPRAAAAGCALLTGFGLSVAGNLVGALAVRDGGQATRRVDIAYLFSGKVEISSGSRATAVFSVTQRAHALRDRVLVMKPFAREVRTFRDGARRHQAALFGGTEPLALVRVAPQLTDIATYLGGLGVMTQGAQVASYVIPLLLRVPAVEARLRASAAKTLQHTGEGPNAATRAQHSMLVLAVAYDTKGAELATVRMQGGSAYEFTARMMAYAARRLAAGEIPATGALGPVDAFGIDELERASAEAGLRRA